MHRRLRFALPLLVLPVAAYTATGVAASGPKASATVTLKDIAYTPAHVTIRKGGRVTFQWRDGSSQHNVTSSGRKFHSLGTRRSGAATVRFTKAGRYPYHCTIHAGMSGLITVR